MKYSYIFCVFVLLVKLSESSNKLLSIEFGQSDPQFAKRLRRAVDEAAGSGDDLSNADDTDASGSGENADGSGSGSLKEPDDNEDGNSDCEGSGGSGGCEAPVITKLKTTKTPVQTKTSRKQTTKQATVVDINTTQRPSQTGGKSVAPSKPGPASSARPKDSATTINNIIHVVKPTQSQNNSVEEGDNSAIVGSVNNDGASGGVDYSIGIIIGIVVGLILAILIILFLVYRIRKKDSGSYILDEKSSHDPMLQDDDSQKGGKEYFA